MGSCVRRSLISMNNGSKFLFSRVNKGSNNKYLLIIHSFVNLETVGCRSCLSDVCSGVRGLQFRPLIEEV